MKTENRVRIVENLAAFRTHHLVIRWGGYAMKNISILNSSDLIAAVVVAAIARGTATKQDPTDRICETATGADYKSPGPSGRGNSSKG